MNGAHFCSPVCLGMQMKCSTLLLLVTRIVQHVAQTKLLLDAKIVMVYFARHRDDSTNWIICLRPFIDCYGCSAAMAAVSFVQVQAVAVSAFQAR